MSPIVAYRQLLTIAGPGYVIVAFLGRLPLAMSQLATLLLVAGSTGSFAVGGLAAGVVATANAIAAPVAGGIADRLGQRPVVLVQSLAAATALTGLVLLSSAAAAPGVIFVAAAAAGLSIPHVGPLARVRWRPMTRVAGADQTRLVSVAFSYEGAADEASFVLGPALVGALAVLVSPAGALLTAAALLAVFGCAFALHPTADLTRPDRQPAGRVRSRVITVGLVVLAAAQFLIGVIFGTIQTGTTVLATAAGSPGLAGLLQALLGVGSVLAGLSVAALPERFALDRRLILFASALLVFSAPLLLVNSLTNLVPVMLVVGFAVAPYMITVFSLAERAAPPGRVSAALTLLAGVTGIGYAVGAAVAGWLADLGGHQPAYALTVAAAALAIASAVGASRSVTLVR